MERKPLGHDNYAMELEEGKLEKPRSRSNSSVKGNELSSEMGDIPVTEPEINADIVDQQWTVQRTPQIRRSVSYISKTEETGCPEDIPPSDKVVEDQIKDDVKDNTLFSRRMTIAGGFLDVALFTSNCEQLKSILEIKDVHLHYELVLGLLITSMILQGITGLTLFMVGCYTIRNPADRKRAEILNHITIGLIVLITAVNIFISSFTVKGEVLNRCSTCLKASGY